MIATKNDDFWLEWTWKDFTNNRTSASRIGIREMGLATDLPPDLVSMECHPVSLPFLIPWFAYGKGWVIGMGQNTKQSTTNFDVKTDRSHDFRPATTCLPKFLVWHDSGVRRKAVLELNYSNFWNRNTWYTNYCPFFAVFLLVSYPLVMKG